MTNKTISPLRQRMIEDMTVRRFTAKTQSDYIRSVRNLAAFLGRSPDTATAEDLRRAGAQADGSPAEMVGAKAKDLATKHLARRAASTTAKKAAESSPIVKSKPASAPPPTETPKPLRDLVRASLLRQKV